MSSIYTASSNSGGVARPASGDLYIIDPPLASHHRDRFEGRTFGHTPASTCAPQPSAPMLPGMRTVQPLPALAEDAAADPFDIPAALRCPLSRELFCDPVLSQIDGHTYEKQTFIEAHGGEAFVRNYALADAADAWRDARRGSANPWQRVREVLICCFSQDLLPRDSVTCLDGRTYGRVDLERFLLTSEVGPFRDEVLRGKPYLANSALAQLLEQVEKNSVADTTPLVVQPQRTGPSGPSLQELNERELNTWFGAGERHYAARAWRDVIHCMDEVLVLNTHIADAWRMRGRAHLELGHLDDAIRSLHPVRESCPHARKYFIAALCRRGEELRQKGLLNAAQRDAEHVLTLDPTHTAARTLKQSIAKQSLLQRTTHLLARARAALDDRQLQAALDLCDEILAADPHHATARACWIRALLTRMADNASSLPNSVIQDGLRILRVDPRHPRALAEMRDAYSLRIARAQMLQGTSGVAPTGMPTWLVSRGHVHQALGNTAAAIADWQHALQLAPHHVEAVAAVVPPLYARAYQRLITPVEPKERRAGLQDLFEVLRLDSNHGDARQLAGSMLIKRAHKAATAKRYGEAARIYRQVLRYIDRPALRQALHVCERRAAAART